MKKKDSVSDFDDILQSYNGFIANSLRTYEQDVSRREELHQEVAFALWRALPSFRGDASLKTFVARITHNIGVSHVRRAVRRRPMNELDENLAGSCAQPDDVAERNDRQRLLLSAISQLPIGIRQAITLHLEDFTNREIAETLGIKSGAVAVRLTRARESLAKILEKTL